MPTGDPEIIIGKSQANYKEDNMGMWENNYIPLGNSSFTGRPSQVQAKIFGREIHADKIILYTEYVNTQSGAIPMTIPNVQTSNIQGMVGSTLVSGQATTYGTQTQYMPYSVERYNCGATYWVKSTPPVLGILYGVLSDEQMKQIGSHKGVVADGVVRDSPAFNADIFKGDVIKKIDDTEVIDKKMFGDLLHKITGKKVTITLWRDGKELTKTVQTNAKPEGL